MLRINNKRPQNCPINVAQQEEVLEQGANYDITDIVLNPYRTNVENRVSS